MAWRKTYREKSIASYQRMKFFRGVAAVAVLAAILGACLFHAYEFAVINVVIAAGSIAIADQAKKSFANHFDHAGTSGFVRGIMGESDELKRDQIARIKRSVNGG